MERRSFLKSAGAAAFFVNAPSDLVAAAASAKPQVNGEWDQGLVRHLLPTVSDTEMLIKVSLNEPQLYPPILRVDSNVVTGKMTDTQGEFWQFFVKNLNFVF
jgi:hypothetical protein